EVLGSTALGAPGSLALVPFGLPVVGATPLSVGPPPPGPGSTASDSVSGPLVTGGVQRAGPSGPEHAAPIQKGTVAMATKRNLFFIGSRYGRGRCGTCTPKLRQSTLVDSRFGTNRAWNEQRSCSIAVS